MAFRTLLAVICSLLISSSVLAQSSSGGASERHSSQFTQVVQHHVNSLRSWWQRHIVQRPVRPAQPVVRAVPELDGNMAFLALGLTFAVGALAREKRRNT